MDSKLWYNIIYNLQMFTISEKKNVSPGKIRCVIGDWDWPRGVAQQRPDRQINVADSRPGQGCPATVLYTVVNSI